MRGQRLDVEPRPLEHLCLAIVVRDQRYPLTTGIKCTTSPTGHLGTSSDSDPDAAGRTAGRAACRSDAPRWPGVRWRSSSAPRVGGRRLYAAELSYGRRRHFGSSVSPSTTGAIPDRPPCNTRVLCNRGGSDEPWGSSGLHTRHQPHCAAFAQPRQADHLAAKLLVRCV